jgi:hypothetical protein
VQNEVEERRALIRSIVAALPVQGDDEDCRFIASEWLLQWANTPPSSHVPAIDNQDLLCAHGLLEPTAWSSAKRISVAAWAELQGWYRGSPELGIGDLCEECTVQCLQEIVAKCASSRVLAPERERAVTTPVVPELLIQTWTDLDSLACCRLQGTSSPSLFKEASMFLSAWKQTSVVNSTPVRAHCASSA